MNRYRLVTITSNERGVETHVSSVVQTLVEAVEGMEVEAMIARNAGWTVSQKKHRGAFAPMTFMRRGETTRALHIRQSTPMDDAV